MYGMLCRLGKLASSLKINITKMGFCCTIFINYVRVSTILTTFSLKIIPRLIVKISKSHISEIPKANLWEFWVKFCWIWYKIDENGSNILNNSFNFKILWAMDWMDQPWGAPYFNNYVCRIRFPKYTPIQCHLLKLHLEVISYHRISSSTT